ncbi:MAG: futalosine hydrolase [Bacteroidota bacterium]|nr:futalosine hydrolase [Bacteroidota bacterium]
MNVLVVAATKLEIEPFLKKNNKADVLITGVGVPATVFHLTKKLISKNYDFVFQAGIAGTFNDSINLKDVVLVREDTFGDLGINENGNFKTLFEASFSDKNDFPYTNGWLVNNDSFFEKKIYPFVKAITVNKITNDHLQIKNMQQKFSAQIESMEGAAFHYVCLQQKINFLQLRAISNIVGERDKTKWQIKNAVNNLNEELIKIIDNL